MSTTPTLKLPHEPEAASEPALQIRYGQVGMVQLLIRTTDPGAILDELTGRVATAPRFFQRTGISLDLSGLERVPEVAELRAVSDAVRRAGMIVIALAAGSPEVETLSAALSLPVLTNFRPQNPAVPIVQPLAAAAAPAEPESPPTIPPAHAVPTLAAAPPPSPRSAAEVALPPVASAAMQSAGAEQARAAADEYLSPTLLHVQPVRSGQRVHARGRDLVVTAGVGPAAELIADGCVHVYGPFRGRAMAGARGDTTARIFSQDFHAELVSIAGVFKVFETIPPELAGKPVQAWLEGDDLKIAAIRS